MQFSGKNLIKFGVGAPTTIPPTATVWEILNPPRNVDISLSYDNGSSQIQQECIPVRCLPPARWPYHIVSNGGWVICPAPWMQTLPHIQTPPGCRPPPVDRMTNTSKNITLPKTSFAGGNYKHKHLSCFPKHYFVQPPSWSLWIPNSFAWRKIFEYSKNTRPSEVSNFWKQIFPY